MTAIAPIPGHHLLLLLVQAALLLVVARVLGELSRRIGQPAVIGELSAGLVLGPSLLGWVAPSAFAALFPRDPAQFHLLELLGWLGMILLMLLTGLETDVRRLAHLGRAAFSASLFGMIVPGAFGALFALALPDSLLAEPTQRPLFAAFVATAMAISAMPVIAKVLRDLDVTRRDIGILILTAGVVDDTTGWLVLSVIAATVSGTFTAMRLGRTLALLAAFLLAARFVLYPAARWMFRFASDRLRSRDNDLALSVVLTFLAAAATDAIGVHPVFGAFVVGCVLRQVPRLQPASMLRLESVVLAIFAPLFFGLVGLKVDLRAMHANGALLFLAALAVATAGKVVGCTAGGLVGRLPFWEALSVGVGMNARGAMGLVVALIGLDLGILSPSIYSVLVLVAIATSFMAPVGLRFTLARVAMSDAERERLTQRSGAVLPRPEAMRTLLLTVGGPNALAAARLLATILRGADASLRALYVEPAGAKRSGLGAWFRRGVTAGTAIEAHLSAVRGLIERSGATFTADRRGGDARELASIEAARGVDLIALGLGRAGGALSGPLCAELLRDPPANLLLVSAHVPDDDQPAPPPRGRVLVLSDGSHASRAAVELAVLHAEGTGAELTVVHALDATAAAGEDLPDGAMGDAVRRMMATTLLESTTPLLQRTRAKVRALVEEANPDEPPLQREAMSGDYDLVVVGAEHRALLNRLSSGYDVERLCATAPCGVAVVVPHFGGSGEVG